MADSDGMRSILHKEASIVKVRAQRPLCINWKDVFMMRRSVEDDQLLISSKTSSTFNMLTLAKAVQKIFVTLLRNKYAERY